MKKSTKIAAAEDGLSLAVNNVANTVQENEAELRAILGTLHACAESAALVEILDSLGAWRKASELYAAAAFADAPDVESTKHPAAALNDDMQAAFAHVALTVECPVCWCSPGVACHTASGSPRGFHETRYAVGKNVAERIADLRAMLAPWESRVGPHAESVANSFRAQIRRIESRYFRDQKKRAGR